VTPEQYVSIVQELARQRDYPALIAFVERVGPGVEDQLTAEHVRILRVHLKHADMVLAETRSRVNTA
jgi:hypothetical protein